MAAHSNILAWTILWTAEPGGLQSKGSQRVEHNRATEHIHNENLLNGTGTSAQFFSNQEWMYAHIELTHSAYSRNEHNIAKQLYSNKN